MKQLNIGCGKNLLKGYLNIDIRKPYDMKINLNKFPYPFKTNSVDYVLMDNVLEHLDNPVKVIEELYRITKPSGHIKIIVPFYNCHHAYADITHKSFYCLDTFDNFDIEKKDKFYNLSKAKFTIKKTLIPTILACWIPYDFLNIIALTFGNIVRNIIFEMRPIK